MSIDIKHYQSKNTLMKINNNWEISQNIYRMEN